MREQYFGDSYDIVKQSLLRWLRHFGEWSIQPMLTEPASLEFISSLGEFLGARVISTEVLTIDTDRSAYFSCANSCGNLFLDPSTGMRLENFRGDRAAEYIFASDLARLVGRRASSLTIVSTRASGVDRRGSKSKRSFSTYAVRKYQRSLICRTLASS